MANTTHATAIGVSRQRKNYDPEVYSTGRIADEVVDVYEMSSSLIATLAPLADKIAKAKEMFGLEAVLEVILTVTPDDSKSTPAIGFESEVITFLHRVGATIDIDTYRGES